MLIKEPNAVFPIDGIIQGEQVQKSVRCYQDIESIFAKHDEQLAPETVMYEVYKTVDERPGSQPDLMWGLSILHPLTVAGECNMTKGHFHADAAQGEVYYGNGGTGLLLLMDRQGNTWAEKVFKGSVHIIDGRYGHRLVNTGDELLKVVCCWSVKAGYDYAYVQTHPFKTRVFKEKGALIIK